MKCRTAQGVQAGATRSNLLAKRTQLVHDAVQNRPRRPSQDELGLRIAFMARP